VTESPEEFGDFDFDVGEIEAGDVAAAKPSPPAPLPGGERRRSVDTASGKWKRLAKMRDPTYVLYSPDGARLAVTRMADQPQAPIEDQPLPELVLVDPETGATKVLASNVAALFRWLPDSQRVAIVQAVRKAEHEQLLANLSLLDVETGVATPVVQVLTGQECHLDLSPDGRIATVCAADVGEAGVELHPEEFPRTKLFRVNLETKQIEKVGPEASYAIFSPDGKSLLVGGRGTDELDAFTLRTADAELTKFVEIATGVYPPPSLASGAYPGWIDNEQVFYFAERAVYGTQGKALTLMLASRDGTNSRCVQPLIDVVAVGVAPP
jgi:hypothetical protein